jgi:hypothetical protein
VNHLLAEADARAGLAFSQQPCHPGPFGGFVSTFAVILERCGIGMDLPAGMADDVHRLTAGLGNLECTLVGSPWNCSLPWKLGPIRCRVFPSKGSPC